MIEINLCYNSKPLELDLWGNLVLGNTRELNRELFYKIVYLIYFYRWSVLATVHPTLNDHVENMTTCDVHIVWRHFVPEPFTSFFLVPWSMLWPHYQMWLMWLITSNPNPRVLKIEKWKINQNENKKENKKKQSLLLAILTILLRWADLTLSEYLQSVIPKDIWIKYRNLSGNRCKYLWDWARYLDCRSSLEAYS